MVVSGKKLVAGKKLGKCGRLANGRGSAQRPRALRFFFFFFSSLPVPRETKLTSEQLQTSQQTAEAAQEPTREPEASQPRCLARVFKVVLSMERYRRAGLFRLSLEFPVQLLSSVLNGSRQTMRNNALAWA